MVLKSIKYKVPDGGWHFEGQGGMPLNLGQINLVVGQNATGKTKTIENILSLVALISQTIILNRTITLYELIFDNNGSEIFYHLNFDKNGIQEILKVNNELKLDRKAEKLFYEEQGLFLPFKTRDMTLAITNSNTLQHPFFEHMHNWSRNVLNFQFGGHMGRKNNDFNKRNNIVPDRKDEAFFIDLPSICEKGQKEFGENFNIQITKDFNSIGYDIENIFFVNKETVGSLGIIDKEIGGLVFHTELSQGMFRALSLIIQLNYSLLSNQPSLILIDDIGEGLDYERSKKLIDLIIKKIEGTQVQLIMTTNDRFVMNKVPLKYWQVIKREKNKSVFYNYENSKQTFDDFALTGLSNFDFFATEFFVKGFDEYVKVNP